MEKKSLIKTQHEENIWKEPVGRQQFQYFKAEGLNFAVHYSEVIDFINE